MGVSPPILLVKVRQMGSSHVALGGASQAAVAVREAVHALAAPAVAERILRRALDTAEAPAIPTGGSTLQRFVESHLEEATAYVLGADAAEALRAQLAPLVARIPSLRPAPASDAQARASAMPTPVPEASPTHVLVATLNEDRLRGVEHALADHCLVELVEDVVALFDAIQRPAAERLVVVVDCRDPSVQAATLATIASDLPPRSLVVLWGATDGALDETRTLVGDAAQWIVCGDDAGPETIGAMVRTLR